MSEIIYNIEKMDLDPIKERVLKDEAIPIRRFYKIKFTIMHCDESTLIVKARQKKPFHENPMTKNKSIKG